MICCKCLKRLYPEESWYGLHTTCFAQWFHLPEARQFIDLVARSQSLAPQVVPQDDQMAPVSFFSGAYRKYSACLGEDRFILKIQQQEYPELPATEFLCNQIYESLKISIPEYYLIRFPEDQLCFVTKNFMSQPINADLIHIYHFLKKGQIYDCETLVNIVGEQTKRKREQERLVHLTLADSLTGNHDRHGRNLGFIQSARGTILTPFYDNPSALALEDHSLLGADLQPRGAIFTQATDKPTVKDYVQEWTRLGYGAAVARFRKRYALSKIRKLIAKSHISEKRQKALLKLITQRGEELCKN